jgi:TRAP-type mannitol/chloroaromatic compound transport system permease small subunit
MRAIAHQIDRFTALAGWLAGWIILPLIMSMLWEVVSRYVLSRPTIWAYEAAYIQMGALFVLGIAYVTQTDGHVRVDLAYANFRPRVQAIVNLLGNLLVAPLVLWLCFGLFDYLYDAWESGERSGESLWNPYVWPARLAFWLGFVLLAAQTVSELLKNLATLVSGPADEGAA